MTGPMKRQFTVVVACWLLLMGAILLASPWNYACSISSVVIAIIGVLVTLQGK